MNHFEFELDEKEAKTLLQCFEFLIKECNDELCSLNEETETYKWVSNHIEHLKKIETKIKMGMA